ncbi:hypothetical protein SAMN05444285_12556 [Draconibacterium orientale]|uniref:Uncharacterized protein n=1 Tax=Draconibacterium orientale TaxID=1168034 RepID=X5DKG0_9BACT|nr:hypothetical protein [Draconibacterium orientale]AHW61659.1 hypothetical protein FH5T_05965 [Draconibacterium orientale]SET84640.1 hypothetical protein SAMN05444285_12556 [Draconibacterium orientale]
MEVFKEIAWSVGPFIVILVVPVIVIFVLRWLGAWILRITDVINLQKEILEELKKLNTKEKQSA